MKYRELRKTGMMISEISLGSWQTLGQAVDSKSSRECVAAALDAGINFFDTADVYGFGDAERLLGECLRDVPREKYRIGTKCFFPMSDDPADRGLSRQHVFRSVERSLRNLGVGPIDLFQCHRFDPSVPLVETVEALNDLVRQGKILHWGVSRWTAGQLREASTIARSLGFVGPSAAQEPYNLMKPDAEGAIFEACRELAMSVLAYSPLAQGVLTGKYRVGREPPPGSRAADPDARKTMWNFETKSLERAQRLEKQAREFGYDLKHLALAWCLRYGEVASVIIGASSPEQVRDNVKASGMILPTELLEEIRRGERTTA